MKYEHYNLEKAKEIFEKEKYQLVSTEYKNCVEKLEYVCPAGHKGSINIHNWNKGHRCPICGGSKKKDIEFIRKEFEKEGYQLLSTEYKDKDTKLEYICPVGHKWQISWGKWQQGRRCKICKDQNLGNIVRFSYEEVKRRIEENNEILLSDSYVNSTTPLKIKCENGHEYETQFTYWSNGHRCQKCAREGTAIKLRDSFENVKSIFEKFGYTLISTEYKSRSKKLLYKCPKGHVDSMNTTNFLFGHRCPQCLGPVSKEEEEVKDFLKDKIEFVGNTKSLIYPYEIDILVPEKKYAIEFCGLYWHSTKAGKSKNYHINKLKRCEKEGYNLITIFEDEWLFNKDLVKKRLLMKLGLFSGQKIYARDCIVKEINNIDKKEFLNRNHIQGDDKSSIKLGAYFKDELVAVMTFMMSYKEKKVHELSRFCSDYRYSVVGIAGKLFGHFVKTYKPTRVITYGDRRWNTGKVYEKLGFKHQYNTTPNYWYIIGNKRIHRFNFRKNNITYFKNYSPEKSEREITEAEGCLRIYDCGNSKWVWNN